jgi:transcriptional antiterminator RfaH
MAYWAVARTDPNHERLAGESVAQAGFETFAPKQRVRVGARWRTVPLFPGYLFVRVVDRWRIRERTQGVLKLVKFGDAPARCPDAEIAQLIARADPDGIVRLPPPPPAARLSPGATVVIADGPLQGFTAIYEGQTANERERVLIDLLGRQAPVDLRPSQLADSRHLAATLNQR